jgi:S-formylglutathione hydrolase
MLELISEHQAFGGWQRFYRHDSKVIGLPMRFAVYTPPQAAQQSPLPALFFLAGLTCTEETFAIKAGAQRYAAQHGIILITPDTSPRGANVPGETDAWDLGVGAGFYLNATTPAWRPHYQMERYIVEELFDDVIAGLGVDTAKVGVFGHSMGGHGALVLALRHQAKFKSVSAFAPIAHPTQCPWGKKAFTAYLGEDVSAWEDYDASLLMQKTQQPFAGGILIDQGLSDKFLAEQLYPEAFEAACQAANQPLTLRRHAGYDHGYYFIATFIEEHIAFHAKQLVR